MPDIFLRAGQANPSDVKLTDPTTADSAGANTTGTIAATQAVQTGALVAAERFIATSAVSQAVQSGAIVGREAFRATSAVSQPVQTGAIVAAERFGGTIAATQATQTGSLTSLERFILAGATAQPAQTGALAASERTIATIAAVQPAQTGSLTATTVYVEPPVVIPEPPRHGERLVAGFERQPFRKKVKPVVLLPSVAAIVTMQPSQRGSLRAFTSDDELVLALAA